MIPVIGSQRICSGYGTALKHKFSRNMTVVFKAFGINFKATLTELA